MKFLVTGAAGFIGMHVAQRLLARGDEVIGVDNLNDYYDLGLKRTRLACLQATTGFRFRYAELADREGTARLFDQERPGRVVHLAAQAGVRHSIEHPHDYADANLVAFLNVLEGCRRHSVEHLVFASSSSVYGGSTRLPFSEDQGANHPVSLYAATKRANELMSHSYSHLFGLPVTGLRLFTVYGPWGRPDMAPMLFARAILAGEPLRLFNHGRMSRDFTFIDDVADAVVRVADRPPRADGGFDRSSPQAGTSWAPWHVFNVGQGRPTQLGDFVSALERALGRRAVCEPLPMQPGDVDATAADCSRLHDWIGPRPATALDAGVGRFVDWYRNHYATEC